MGYPVLAAPQLEALGLRVCAELPGALAVSQYGPARRSPVLGRTVRNSGVAHRGVGGRGVAVGSGAWTRGHQASVPQREVARSVAEVHPGPSLVTLLKRALMPRDQQGLWSAQDEDTQLEQLAHLEEAIRLGRCVVFVGAGVSTGAGYPDWHGFMKDLAGAAGMSPPSDAGDGSDYLDFAEECKRALGDSKYIRFLEGEFDPAGKQPFLPVHSYLVKMPFNAFITTNFDSCLENAARNAGDMDTVVQRYPYLDVGSLGSERSCHVYHIHGRAYDENGTSDAPTMVVTARDYERAYHPQSHIRNLLREVLRYRDVLFVGASLQDPGLNQVLTASQEEAEYLRQEAERCQQAALPPRTHFALMPIKLCDSTDAPGPAGRDREAEQQDQGWLGDSRISVLRYVRHEEDRTHGGLIAIVEQLRYRTGRASSGVVSKHALRTERER